MHDTPRTKILLALDLSQQAENAVHYLAGLPLAGRAQITLFHVRRNLASFMNSLGFIPDLPRQLEPDRVEDWLKEEEEILEQLLDSARQTLLKAGYPEKDVAIKMREVDAGFARDIIAEAKEGYSAVVVGRTGMSKLKDLVMGSIATKLVARLDKIPVWVVGGQPQGKKMLVALDSSEGSMRVVDHVADSIGPGPMEVLLFNVIRSFEYGGKFAQLYISPDIERKLNQEGEKQMEPVFNRAKERLVGAGLPESSVNSMLVTGVASRAGAVVQEAGKQGFDTIVVGRRGISKVEEYFIGRVGNKVLSFAKKHAVWVVG